MQFCEKFTLKSLPNIFCVFITRHACKCKWSSHDVMKKLSKCHLNLNRWQERTCWDMAVEVANYKEVIDSLHDPEILLIDVRDPSEIADSGSIPTSLNIPCKIKISCIISIILFLILIVSDQDQIRTSPLTFGFHCQVSEKQTWCFSKTYLLLQVWWLESIGSRSSCWSWI